LKKLTGSGNRNTAVAVAVHRRFRTAVSAALLMYAYRVLTNQVGALLLLHPLIKQVADLTCALNRLLVWKIKSAGGLKNKPAGAQWGDSGSR
jgi:hypothetical protein